MDRITSFTCSSSIESLVGAKMFFAIVSSRGFTMISCAQVRDKVLRVPAFSVSFFFSIDLHVGYQSDELASSSCEYLGSRGVN